MTQPKTAALKKMVYISGPLTSVDPDLMPSLKAFYESMGKLCNEFGFEAYIPHMFSDPDKAADLTAAQVDLIDRKAVTSSYLVLAYVGVPAIGCGIEVEMAYHANVPVFLIYEESDVLQTLGKRVTRLVLGNPGVKKHIRIVTFEQGLHEIRAALKEFVEQMRDTVLPNVLLPFTDDTASE